MAHAQKLSISQYRRCSFWWKKFSKERVVGKLFVDLPEMIHKMGRVRGQTTYSTHFVDHLQFVNDNVC